MPTFVHLTQEKDIKHILRSGIKSSKLHLEKPTSGVFCMPLINDYYASHQWARELRRFEKKNIVAIYFRIDDSEKVYFGHYSTELKNGLAYESFNDFISLEDKMGYQTIIPRSIKPNEILRVKPVSQIIGWRYHPSAKGKRICLCPGCIRSGEVNSKKIYVQKFNDLISELRKSTNELELRNVLQEINQLVSINPKRTFNDIQSLLFLTTYTSIEIVIDFIKVISNFTGNEALKLICSYLSHDDVQVKLASVEAIFNMKGERAFEYIEGLKNIPEISSLIDEYKSFYFDID